MKVKKVPMRTCVVTKEKYPKKDLIRIVKTPDGNIIIDESGKSNGHGAYLKKDLEVINKAEKSKILDNVFNEPVLEEIFVQLRSIINSEDNQK